MASPKRAQLFAGAVEVFCPYCGEPQPSPDSGSHLWEVRLVLKRAGETRACAACCARFRLSVGKRVDLGVA